MAKVDDDIDKLLAKLMPVLERAVHGDFSGSIKMDEDDPFNEVYAGVQVLLEVIQEQTAALNAANVNMSARLAQQLNPTKPLEEQS